MTNTLYILAIFLSIEVLAFLIFSILNYVYNRKSDADTTVQKESSSKFTPIFKGFVERGCLFFALYLGFPQMLIAFGALKVGTKLGKDCQVSNDYYLVGNMTSISLVFLTYFLCRDCFGLITAC